MLDPWIIEEIRKREEKRREAERPRVVPIMPVPPTQDCEQPEPDAPERGVVTFDI